ncbi:MAG: hypothetical protein ACU0E9_01370 [Limimaricola soesokkakensis]|uniref:hypothetical protein n=1 Tax=Limimaricola soesokkakensis TaxID=1343159 RepID=UPI0040598358
MAELDGEIVGARRSVEDQPKERRIEAFERTAFPHDITTTNATSEYQCAQGGNRPGIVKAAIQSAYYVVSTNIARVPDLVVQATFCIGLIWTRQDPARMILTADVPSHDLVQL